MIMQLIQAMKLTGEALTNYKAQKDHGAYRTTVQAVYIRQNSC